MNYTLRHIEVFLAVAKTQHIGQAAGRISLSQSAVSMALADFERLLGMKLFDRYSRRIALNDAGRQLVPLAQALMDAASEVERFSTVRQPAGHITIGASTTIGNYLLPSLLGSFHREFPQISFSLEVGNTAHIVKSVADFELDIGFIEGPTSASELKLHPWKQDQLIVFASPQLALPTSITEIPWIVREEGSGTREVFEAAMSEAGNAVNIAYELGHSEAIKNAVAAGLGVGCLSEETIRRELEAGILQKITLPQLRFSRKLNIAVHRKKYFTQGLHAFFTFVCQ